MSYRVEIASGGRAGCQAKRCKDAAVKIQKGELRMGVMVTIRDHQSWQWRHWGCVTPTQLRNWWEAAGEDLELVDGYEELPEDAQAKIKTSLEQGHVDDEDWNGDPGYNRFNPSNPKQGMYAKTPKKKAAEEEEANGEPESPTKQPAKKRSRVKDEDADEDVKPTKKAKGSKKADAEEAEPAKKTKKVKKEPEDDEAPAPKKRQTKSKAVKTEEPDEEEAAEEKPKKSRAKKVKTEDASEDAPKKGRKKKAPAVEEPEEEDEDEPEPEPKPKRKGRKAAA